MKINQLPAALTDRVIVTTSFAIVAAGTVAKIDFQHQTRFFQIAQRVVDGGIADAGQALPGGLEDIAGRRVVVARENHLKHRFPLPGQLVLADFPGVVCFLCHSGFRLILNPGIVKCAGGLLRNRRSVRRSSQKAGI